MFTLVLPVLELPWLRGMWASNEIVTHWIRMYNVPLFIYFD